MRIFLILYIFAICIPPSFALDICEAALETCEPLQHNDKKYQRCAEIVCGGQDTPENAPELTSPQPEDISCDIGKRKCDSLRATPLYYWSCMEDVCASEDVNLNPSCHKGHNQCQKHIANYWTCTSKICKTPLTEYKECPQSRDSCSANLTTYWGCVSEVCLGDVHQYLNPEYYRDKEISPAIRAHIPDSPEEYSAPPMIGVDDKYKYAPAGVDPKDWLSNVVAPDRVVVGSPSQYLNCRKVTANVLCATQDVSSCYCSDGTYPMRKDTNPTIAEIAHNIKAKKSEFYHQKYKKMMTEIEDNTSPLIKKFKEGQQKRYRDAAQQLQDAIARNRKKAYGE